MTENTRYSNAMIYKICSFKTDLFIVDGCCCTLARRKQDLKKLKNPVISEYTERFPDYYLIIVEKYPCENKDFLNARVRTIVLEKSKYQVRTLSDLDILKNKKRIEFLDMKHYEPLGSSPLSDSSTDVETTEIVSRKVVTPPPLPAPMYRCPIKRNVVERLTITAPGL